MAKKSLSFLGILLVVSVVAFVSAAKTDILGNLLKAKVASGDGLSCTLQSDSATPPNVSIKKITGGTGNYECNFPGQEMSGFPIFSSASCSTPHASGCTGIGNCPIVATVRDAGVSPKAYAACSISVKGQGIPATGCPSGFALSGGICVGATSTPIIKTGGGDEPINTTTTTAVLPQTSSSTGQISFQKVFFDDTDLITKQNTNQINLSSVNKDGTFIPEVKDMKIATFGNKKFLFVLTGGNIDTYDLADPFNPKLVGSADPYSNIAKSFDSAAAASSRNVFQKIEVADNFPYGIIYTSKDGNPNPNNGLFATVFKINPSTGAISFTNFYSTLGNNPYSFYPTEMRLLSSGSKVYLVTYADNKNNTSGSVWDKYAITIFDFSSPENSINLIYQFPSNFGPTAQSKTQPGTTLHLAQPNDFEVLSYQGKNYLLIASDDGSGFGTNVFAYVHSGTDWTTIFDMTSPQSPKQVLEDMSYKLFGWFDYANGLGLLLNNVISQYLFDPTNGRLYVTSGITQGDSLMDKPSLDFEARFNLNVMDFSKLPAISKISDIIIRAAKHLDTYSVPGPDPSVIKPYSGFIDFEYMAKKSDVFSSKGQAINQNGITGDCYNDQFALFGVEKNGVLTYMADPSGELDKAKDVIKNKDRSLTALGDYSNKNVYCYLTPTSVAILPVNSTTLAVYRARSFYAEVNKVTLSLPISIPKSGTVSTSTSNQSGSNNVLQNLQNSNSMQSSFSFQSLLNIFRTLLNRN